MKKLALLILPMMLLASCGTELKVDTDDRSTDENNAVEEVIENEIAEEEETPAPAEVEIPAPAPTDPEISEEDQEVVVEVIPTSEEAPTDGSEVVTEEETEEASNEEVSEEEAPVADVTSEEKVAVIKEFSMESFTEIKDGKYFPQFSPNTIEVNEGDTVRINVTTTSGVHDFKLDEFGVYEETPKGETVTIEFIADKKGEFQFYCNKPGHRANGHWGTLTVK